MDIEQLARKRWRIAIGLTILNMIIYFGFILLVAFQRDLITVRVVDGLSLGVLLGALVIVEAWASTWFYVRWANKHFDGEVTLLRDKDEKMIAEVTP